MLVPAFDDVSATVAPDGVSDDCLHRFPPLFDLKTGSLPPLGLKYPRTYHYTIQRRVLSSTSPAPRAGDVLPPPHRSHSLVLSPKKKNKTAPIGASLSVLFHKKLFSEEKGLILPAGLYIIIGLTQKTASRSRAVWQLVGSAKQKHSGGLFLQAVSPQARSARRAARRVARATMRRRPGARKTRRSQNNFISRSRAVW